MTVRELVNVVNTDEYIIINDVTNTCEIVRSYESGSHRAIKKYFDKKVVNITPCGNAVEIRFA